LLFICIFIISNTPHKTQEGKLNFSQKVHSLPHCVQILSQINKRLSMQTEQKNSPKNKMKKLQKKAKKHLTTAFCYDIIFER